MSDKFPNVSKRKKSYRGCFSGSSHAWKYCLHLLSNHRGLQVTSCLCPIVWNTHHSWLRISQASYGDIAHIFSIWGKFFLREKQEALQFTRNFHKGALAWIVFLGESEEDSRMMAGKKKKKRINSPQINYMQCFFPLGNNSLFHNHVQKRSLYFILRIYWF